MKIGIMGGTFDPIHKGHLMLGEYAQKLYDLDKIWFMPNGNPPHKLNSNIESQANHRVEMVKLAIEDYAGFDIQLYEVERKEVNYSYMTMKHFNDSFPEDEFYFIIGADSLFAFESWKHPELLVKTCKILAAYRDGKNTSEMEEQIEYLNEKYGAEILLLNTPNVDVSSSDIRRMIKNNEDISDLVPTSVLSYIQTNKLFRDE